MHCTRVDESEQVISCTEPLREKIIGALASTGFELTIFFLPLFLLPLAWLRSWVLYIGSWSVPLGLLLYLTATPNTALDSMFAPAFTPAAMLQLAVTGWLWLLGGFMLYQSVHSLWSRR